ncbi:MAG: hypothetical protein AB7S74_18830 [Hyphomicrobium sp.]
MDVMRGIGGSGLNSGALSAGIGQYSANGKRPETALEGVTSRLTAILGRVKASGAQTEAAANAVLGFDGEAAGCGVAPESVPTSVCDYLREIEDALGRLERHLGRLT